MPRLALVLVLLGVAAFIAINTAPSLTALAPQITATPTRNGIFAPLIAKPVLPVATATPTAQPIGGVVNGGFEQGHTGWTEIPGNAIITQFGPVPPYSGQWEAVLGGGTGGTDEIQQVITLPQGAPLYLNFAYQGYPNDSSGVPQFNIYINTTPIWTDYPLPLGWMTHKLDVSAYVGQTVTLRFQLIEGQTHPGGMIIDEVFLSR